MRSVLRPVAISCNQSTYHDPFAALIDARAPSETASGASSMLKWPVSCKKTNVAKSAFSEVRTGSHLAGSRRYAFSGTCLACAKVVLYHPSASAPAPRERQTRREAGAQSLRACDERAGSRVAER
jgi:hypothetical protein